MKSTLNSELLSSMIKTKRGKRGLRETALEINISLATLSRVEQGNLPDVETFIKICDWLEVSTEVFVTNQENNVKVVNAKESIIYQLRSSSELEQGTIDAIITLVELAYTKKSTVFG